MFSVYVNVNHKHTGRQSIFQLSLERLCAELLCESPASCKPEALLNHTNSLGKAVSRLAENHMGFLAFGPQPCALSFVLLCHHLILKQEVFSLVQKCRNGNDTAQKE